MVTAITAKGKVSYCIINSRIGYPEKYIAVIAALMKRMAQ